MNERKPLVDNHAEFRKLIQDLECVQINVFDEDQAVTLLNSPPRGNEHFVVTLKLWKANFGLKKVLVAIKAKDIENKTNAKSKNEG